MKNAWQEITVKICHLEEVQSPEFHKFLDEAVDAYLAQSLKEAANPDDLMPWKQLGRKWHVMRKGLPMNGRVPWKTGTVEAILPVLEDVLASCETDYGLRIKINWCRKKDRSPVAELHTKRADGVDLVLLVDHDSMTIGSIAEFGADQKIVASRDGRDAVRIRLVSPSQAKDRKLHQFIRRTVTEILND